LPRLILKKVKRNIKRRTKRIRRRNTTASNLTNKFYYYDNSKITTLRQ
jgi:hypothetical protein